MKQKRSIQELGLRWGTGCSAGSSCQAGLDPGKPSSVLKELSTSLYWGLVTTHPQALGGAGHPLLSVLTLLREGGLEAP